MSKRPRWLLLAGAAVFVVAVLTALAPPLGQAHSSAPELPVPPSSIPVTEAQIAARLQAASDPSTSTPQVEVKQDLCLHCHVSGEDKGVLSPVGRWTIFSVAGLALVFGVYRSASTWVNRKPWKPLTARAIDWVDERYTIKKPMEKILSKPVPNYALRWFYCLGGITAFLFVVQAITGILLAFYYKPSPAEAYASIQYIETQVRFGAAIRSIHHWAANGMIVMCIAHMLRVFITGAYKAPRELNWVGGVLLLILTLAFGFTGYLLPWDQRAFWATTVGTEIAGGVPDLGTLALVMLRAGWTVTEQTLSRFFAAHVLVLPVMIVVLMGLHFLMVRRQGIAKPL